jgi:hypothetical protein
VAADRPCCGSFGMLSENCGGHFSVGMVFIVTEKSCTLNYQLGQLGPSGGAGHEFVNVTAKSAMFIK